LNTVIKSAFRALLRVRLEPEKNTQAFRNWSYDWVSSDFWLIIALNFPKKALISYSSP
jgi:hypothetical protein